MESQGDLGGAGPVRLLFGGALRPHILRSTCYLAVNLDLEPSFLLYYHINIPLLSWARAERVGAEGWKEEGGKEAPRH